MKSSLGLYHAQGRMIPTPELLVDGVVNRLRILPTKITTSSESIFFSSNIIKTNEFWKGIWEGAHLPALKILFFWKVNLGHRFHSSWHTDDGATYGLQNGPSDLLLWTSEVLEKGDK